MAAYYLSDLHLLSGEENKTLLFQRFLEEIPKAGDLLILGGDIFDLFVGNKGPFIEEFGAVLKSIERVSQNGIKVFYLEGNHDFHLKGALPKNDAIIVDTERFHIPMEKVNIYVEHGDLIDPEDYGYRFLRFLFRSLPFRIFLFLLPGFIVRAVGAWSSQKSRKYTDGMNAQGARTDRTRELYRAFAKSKIAEGMDIVLLGHSHLEDQVSIEAHNGARGTYVNLGYSSSSIPYLRLSGESGENLQIERQLFG